MTAAVYPARSGGLLARLTRHEHVDFGDTPIHGSPQIVVVMGVVVVVVIISIAVAIAVWSGLSRVVPDQTPPAAVGLIVVGFIVRGGGEGIVEFFVVVSDMFGRGAA